MATKENSFDNGKTNRVTRARLRYENEEIDLPKVKNEKVQGGRKYSEEAIGTRSLSRSRKNRYAYSDEEAQAVKVSREEYRLSAKKTDEKRTEQRDLPKQTKVVQENKSTTKDTEVVKAKQTMAMQVDKGTTKDAKEVKAKQNDLKVDKELEKNEEVLKKEGKKKSSSGSSGKKGKTKKRRIRWGNVLTIFGVLVSFGALIYSVVQIINWKLDSASTTKQLERINEIVEVEEVDDNDDVIIIEPEVEVPKANPYWDYIRMKLINVDFTELKKINSSTKGWIQVSGTNVNYPFVQANDNEYYLTHSFDKSYNYAGWIFLDYRNDINNLSKNNILYGHSRVDKTMFGSLRDITTNGWLNNKDNYVIKLSTETENTLWQVFSVYRIPTTNDYMKVQFASDEEFVSFGKMLIDRSVHNFETTVGAEDKILTLSTCYIDDTQRVVIHAKLIKKEVKIS